MIEGFYESIVKHIKTPKDRLIDVGFAAAGLAGAVVILTLTNIMNLHVIGAVAAIAAVVFAIRAILFNTWEYEYIVTGSTVDIDQIIARRKRKRAISFDARDCEIIAPANRGHYFAEYKTLPIKDFTAYPGHEDNYFAVVERTGVRTCILFQPTEDMVQLFKTYNPRNVYTA